jgi:hypothetical protein
VLPLARTGLMNSLAVAAIIFASSFGAAVVGMTLHARLLGGHLDSDSKDVIKLVMGLIGTMAALILGLLIASANSSYNAQNSELQSLSVNVVLLDRTLASYGPETKGAREELRGVVRAAHDRIWAPEGPRPANTEAATRFLQQLQGLAPKTETARILQARAMQVAEGILQTRLLMSEQAADSIPKPFLTVLVFWICALFLGFGLFARFNATVALSLLVGALSVAGAIFLILELSTPYRGIMRISDAPVSRALALIGG